MNYIGPVVPRLLHCSVQYQEINELGTSVLLHCRSVSKFLFILLETGGLLKVTFLAGKENISSKAKNVLSIILW